MYKITATVSKPGGMPVNWTRMSRDKLSKTQCEKMLTRKEAGLTEPLKVSLSEFRCVKQ